VSLSSLELELELDGNEGEEETTDPNFFCCCPSICNKAGMIKSNCAVASSGEESPDDSSSSWSRFNSETASWMNEVANGSSRLSNTCMDLPSV